MNLLFEAHPVLNVLDPSPETALHSDENVDHQLLLKASKAKNTGAFSEGP